MQPSQKKRRSLLRINRSKERPGLRKADPFGPGQKISEMTKASFEPIQPAVDEA